MGKTLLRLPRWVGVALTLAWMGLIFRLSSLSKPVPVDVRVPLFFNDFAHAPLFGMVAFLALIALPRRMEPFPWPRLDRRAWWGVLALVALYGISDEIHQSTTPGRDASLGDVITDVVGGFSVLMLARHLGRGPGGRAGTWWRLAAGLALCATAAAASTWLFVD
ncbi:MAG: VanZ family protein [Planctomycetota bacterium]